MPPGERSEGRGEMQGAELPTFAVVRSYANGFDAVASDPEAIRSTARQLRVYANVLESRAAQPNRSAPAGREDRENTRRYWAAFLEGATERWCDAQTDAQRAAAFNALYTLAEEIGVELDAALSTCGAPGAEAATREPAYSPKSDITRAALILTQDGDLAAFGAALDAALAATRPEGDKIVFRTDAETGDLIATAVDATPSAASGGEAKDTISRQAVLDIIDSLLGNPQLDEPTLERVKMHVRAWRESPAGAGAARKEEPDALP